MAKIANASGEQATGLDQVNKALAQMDEVTQQNSALVEENAATAQALRQQAAEMTERWTSSSSMIKAPPSGRPEAAAIFQRAVQEKRGPGSIDRTWAW